MQVQVVSQRPPFDLAVQLKDIPPTVEVWMTVAFEPARGARWKTEYCETHIDAHFGVYRGQKNRETGVVKAKFVGLVPPEHRNPGILFESYQVEKLRKWAPVRTYLGTALRTKRRSSSAVLANGTPGI